MTPQYVISGKTCEQNDISLWPPLWQRIVKEELPEVTTAGCTAVTGLMKT